MEAVSSSRDIPPMGRPPRPRDQDKASEALARNLKSEYQRIGMTRNRVATLSGVHVDVLRSAETKGTLPSADRLEAVARVLERTPGQLLGTEPMNGAPMPINARVAFDAPPAPSIAQMPRDVPVFGTAQGGPLGVFELNQQGEPIDWARRPQALMGVQKVFAIYVEGESMVPWRQPGELVYAFKGRSPGVGNHVIVVFGGENPGDPPRAMIKRLAKRTATRLDLEQYNPPEAFSVDLSTVQEVIRVLEWAEILGV